MSALGKLVVSLSLEYAAFTQGLDKSDQAALKFASNTQRNFDNAARSSTQFMTGIATNALKATAGFVGIYTVISRLTNSIDTLARLDDAAQKTGSSVENLSKFSKVASAFGHDFGSVQPVLIKLSKGMATVDNDTNKTNKALRALGISAKDAFGIMRDPSEVMLEVARKLQGYNDSASKTALINDALGKSGAENLPFLNDLAENFDRMKATTPEAAAAAAKFKDELGLLKGQVNSVFTSAAVDLLPTLTKVTTAMRGSAGGTDFFALAAKTAGSMIQQLVILGGAAGLVFTTVAKYATTAGSQLMMLAKGDFAGIHAAGVKFINETVAEHAAYVTFQSKVIEGNKEIAKSNDAAKKYTLPKKDLQYESGTDEDVKKITALNDASRKFLETLKTETTGVGASTIQTKLLAAAKQAAITPSRDLAMAIMTEAQAWAKLSQFQEEAKDEFAILQLREDAFNDSTNALTDYARATDQANESAQFETSLMGKSALERDIANEQRRAELELKRQIFAITDQVTNAEDRAALIEEAEATGARAKAGARLSAIAKNTQEDWTRMWGTVEQTGKLAFVNLLANGVSSMKSIGQAIKASIIDLLYQITVRKWIINLESSISGGALSSATSAGMSRLLSGFGFGGAGAAMATGSAAAGATGAGAAAAGGSSLAGSTASIVEAIHAGYSGLTGLGTEMFTAFATSAVGQSLGLGVAGGSALGVGVAEGAGAGAAFIGGAGTAIGGEGLTVAGMTSMGEAIGAAIPVVNVLMAASIVAQLMAGDKTISNNKAWGIVSAIPIVNIIPNLLNAFFGHGPKKVSGPQTLVGSFTGSGFEGDLQTPWKAKGGFFAKDKRGQFHDPLGGMLNNRLDSMVTSTSKAFTELASVAGTAGRNLDGFSFAINRQVTTKEQEKQLITDLSNAIGLRLIPELAALQKEDEQLADTALRVRQEIGVTNQLLDMTGQSFGAVGLASIIVRDRLVQLLGGAENAGTALGTFYQNFYTGAEQAASGWRLLNAEMTRIGLTSLPTTREEFRALVEAQDLSTGAGQDLFVSLIGLVPAFTALTEQAVQAKAALTLLTTDSFTTLVDYTRYIRLAANAGIGPKPAEDYQVSGVPATGSGVGNFALLEELRQLRSEQQVGDVAIALNTAAIARVLSRWEGGGMPDVRDITA